MVNFLFFKGQNTAGMGCVLKSVLFIYLRRVGLSASAELSDDWPNCSRSYPAKWIGSPVG